MLKIPVYDYFNSKFRFIQVNTCDTFRIVYPYFIK